MKTLTYIVALAVIVACVIGMSAVQAGDRITTRMVKCVSETGSVSYQYTGCEASKSQADIEIIGNMHDNDRAKAPNITTWYKPAPATETGVNFAYEQAKHERAGYQLTDNRSHSFVSGGKVHHIKTEFWDAPNGETNIRKYDNGVLVSNSYH
mgnify:CR=1 FL=1